MGKTIQAELPQSLVESAQALVDKGWSGSVNEVVTEALRRYLESHGDELSEQLVREDVEWGLRGQD